MRKIAFLLFLLTMPAVSQPTVQATAIGSFPFVADAFVGSDSYGFYYFIKDNTFIKTDGRKTVEFTKNALGRITHVDIGNPLLIVLFYESFNTAILVDNQLNEVKQIDFSLLGSSGNEQTSQTPVVAHAVGMASQNRLWVYDSLSQRIGLYDYLKNVWIPITTPLKEAFNFYQSDFNHFQWADAKSGWFATDIFGKIVTLGKTPEFERINFSDTSMFLYSKNGKLYLKDSKNNIEYLMTGIENSPKNFYYQDQILTIFTGSGITNYKINLP